MTQATGDSLRRQAKLAQDFARKHGFTLSDLTLLDKGRSAFKGNRQKALDQFLELVREGRVKPGDTLLVESIDRLSRKGIRQTQDTVNFLLNAGIDIAICYPVEKIYRASEKNDIGGTIELAAFAYGAFMYSSQLSQRITSYYEEARDKARKNGRIINAAAPPLWLKRIKKDRNIVFEIDKDKLKIIEFIFEQAINGMGMTRLCKLLNIKFPSIARSNNWNETYVRNLLTNRAVLGEYQPHIMRDNKRVPEGEVIKDYFPRVISDEVFIKAQGCLQNRKKERGPSTGFVNIFTGLLFHAVDKCACHIYSYMHKGGTAKRRIQSYAKAQGLPDASSETVDLPKFQHAILGFLRELDLSVFSNNKSKAVDFQTDLKLLEKKKLHLIKLENSLVNEDEDLAPSLLKAIKTTKAAIKELEKKIDSARHLESNMAASSIEQIKRLSEIEDTPENRQKLREALKRVVKQINILPVKLGKNKNSPIATMAQIMLNNGGTRVVYIYKDKTYAYCDDGKSLLELTDKQIEIKKAELITFAKTFD